MENLTRAGRLFYCTGITGIAFQQFTYADFRPVILPPGWPAWLHAPVWAYLSGAVFILAVILILLGKKARTAALYLGGLLFLFFILFQCVFTLFISPNSPRHFGVWTDPLKELALSGGAFAVAGSFGMGNQNKTFLEKLIPAGRIFFSITMIVFGIDHFLYPEFVAPLVPSWIPGHHFWTYFAAVALIGSAICIILKIRLKLVATLLGLMIFLWFIMLHIPRAAADPYGNKGNEITSVFEALAFSGIAFIIANTYKKPG